MPVVSTPTIKDIRAAAAARRSRRALRKKLLVGGIVGLVLAGVVGWLVLPSVIQNQIEKRGGEFLDREISVDRVSLNPLQFAITIEGLAVQDSDGEELLGWSRLYVNGKFWTTVTGGLGADAVELDGLRGRLRMDESGELNVADILAKFSTESDPEAESRPLELDRLEVKDAQIKLIDDSRSRPFMSDIGPVTFAVTDFHTKFDPQAPYEFEASTESGERLRWRGALSTQPLKSTGEFEVSGFNVPKYAAYYADLLPFEVVSGLVEISGKYDLAWTDEEQVLRLAEGDASVTNLTLRDAEAETASQSIAQIGISGIEADLKAKSLRVAVLEVADGAFEIQRTVDGIEWVGVTLVGAAVADGEADPAELPLDDIRIDSFVAERMRYRLFDQTLSETATLGFNINRAELSNAVLTDLSQPLEVTLVGEYPMGGNLDVAGTLVVQPFAPDLKFDINDFSLLTVAPHAKDLAGVELVDGRLSIEGRLSREPTGLGWLGNITVADLAVLDPGGAPLVGVQKAELIDSDIRLDPFVFDVGSVNLAAPTLRVARDSAGNVNLQQIMATVQGPTDDVEVAVDMAPSETTLPRLEIGKITVTEAAAAWHDDAVIAPVKVSVDGVSGELAGWSSQDVARAEVQLSGKVNGVAPFDMTGDLNPFGRPAHADLNIDIERVDLLATDGYIQQYAGFKLDKGKMSLDIDFELRERAIDSDTLTVLDEFTLGPAVQSPDATDLPVKLGVALLKDAKGEIVVDVPVQGHLDDPEFRLGKVIWRVIGNLLTKAATSPFALLGSAIGGGQEVDLEHHQFDAGSEMTSGDTMKSLDNVMEALAARPELAIGIRGEYDPSIDAVALRSEVLEEQLRGLNPQGMDAAGYWRPYEREAALVAYYEQVFGMPPVDPDGELPPPPPPAPEQTVAVDGAPDSVEGDQEGFLAWLRRVITGPPLPAEEGTAPVAAEPSQGSFPIPDDIEPELPVLPMEEITRRVLEQVEVSEEALLELAQARALRTFDYLRDAGLAESRMTLVDPLVGEAQVTLDLR